MPIFNREMIKLEQQAANAKLEIIRISEKHQHNSELRTAGTYLASFSLTDEEQEEKNKKVRSLVRKVNKLNKLMGKREKYTLRTKYRMGKKNPHYKLYGQHYMHVKKEHALRVDFYLDIA